MKKYVPVPKERVRATDIVLITKNAAPTATPTPFVRALGKSGGKKRSLTEYPVVQATVNVDFYLYLCDSGDLPAENVSTKAYFAKMDGGVLVKGPQLTSSYLKATTGYFSGSTTLPVLPVCSGAARAQLKVRIKDTFLTSQPPPGGWVYMFVEACKSDGSGGCDPSGGLLIEVQPAS